MRKFDNIRPFHDHEVRQALTEWQRYPMMKALLRFTFPDLPEKERESILLGCNSVQDFQTKIVYHSVKNALRKSSEGVTISGFEKLRPDTPYLFFSNHRDIVLDTSLLNAALFDHNLIMTASAIGSNLVLKPFLLLLSKLTRTFLIQRGLPPREMLASSRLVSAYIQNLLMHENRSVWIAQREGRTKNGNDKTQQGVLKMLALADPHKNPIAYFKHLNITPVSISYELDPTDMLKIPALLAKHHNVSYVKDNNEDFNTIIKGFLGQKRRIHVAIGDVLKDELDTIEGKGTLNQQFQRVADNIDKAIHKHYKLWPFNYVAYDILYHTERFKTYYSEKEAHYFQRRMKKRIKMDSEIERQKFLAMYAHPVVNKLNTSYV